MAEEYVFVCMTETNFSPNYGGKTWPGDVLEVPKSLAIQWRRIGIAKPATQKQVDLYRLQRYETTQDIEEEEYITSDKEDAAVDTGDDFPTVAQTTPPGRVYNASVSRGDADDDDEEGDETSA